jgi:hypothetical protein
MSTPAPPSHHSFRLLFTANSMVSVFVYPGVLIDTCLLGKMMQSDSEVEPAHPVVSSKSLKPDGSNWSGNAQGRTLSA